ncbi:MAG: hypothetical protein AAF995_08955 [Planctomycetota bacterium]
MIQPDDLPMDAWPGLPPAEQHRLTGTWRQIHHAAQAVADLGKRWGEPADDDSHSAFALDDDHLCWHAIGSAGKRTAHAWLDFASGTLWLDVEGGPGPRQGSWLELDGLTINQTTEWVHRAAERLLGEGPAREGTPAPDLPEHPVSVALGGAAMELDDEGLDALDAIYDAAAVLLPALVETIASELGASAVGDEATPRIWPHHFDAASLIVLERDARGEMTRTVGVGVTPPDSIEGSGYWYVSPWSKGGANGFQTPDLPGGRWHARDGADPMALLSISDLAGAGDAEAQGRLLAAFVASAFNACRA